MLTSDQHEFVKGVPSEGVFDCLIEEYQHARQMEKEEAMAQRGQPDEENACAEEESIEVDGFSTSMQYGTSNQFSTSAFTNDDDGNDTPAFLRMGAACSAEAIRIGAPAALRFRCGRRRKL